jgi:tRNA threonylcarbamoyladenosine biosynthesis protein TsaE
MWQVFFEKIFCAFSRQAHGSYTMNCAQRTMERVWQAKDASETEACGVAMARQWEGPGVIALLGPMGAGKTHFVKGFAKGLGYAGEVTSPTFSIVQEYHGGKWPMFHFDLYRMKHAEELIALGWDDYLEQNAVVLVEWADLFPELMPETLSMITIEITESGRKILYQG